MQSGGGGGGVEQESSDIVPALRSALRPEPAGDDGDDGEHVLSTRPRGESWAEPEPILTRARGQSWGAGSPMAASAEPAAAGDDDDGLGALSGDVIALSSTHVRSVQANDDARRREAALTTLASRGQSPSELAVRLRAPSVLNAPADPLRYSSPLWGISCVAVRHPPTSNPP